MKMPQPRRLDLDNSHNRLLLSYIRISSTRQETPSGHCAPSRRILE